MYQALMVSTMHALFHFKAQQPYGNGNAILPIVNMRKLKFREIKYFEEGYKASRWYMVFKI